MGGIFEIIGVTPAAHARVDRILDGYVLRDQYESTDGLIGRLSTMAFCETAVTSSDDMETVV